MMIAVSPLIAEDGVNLTVTVTNIPAPQGDLLIGLYNSAGSFAGSPLPQSPKVRLTSAGRVTATISGVTPGTYAIAVIQDLNRNGKLDKNLIGMPTEPIAFSVVKKIPKGKPGFAACSFEVKDKQISLSIQLTVK